MTDAEIAGHEVKKQASDDGPLNTEPAVVAGSVVGIVSAIAAILVIGGYIDEDQKRQLESSAGQIVPAVLLIVPIVAALIARIKTYSPRSAARIAVANADQPTGAPPSLAAAP